MRAVGYIRVSSAEQVEGYSLAAQERAIDEACQARGYELIRMYRDEGISAHTDQLSRRPGLVQLLEDAGDGDFDAVFVHTLDRWARNLGVALQAINRLSAARVGLISIAENIDYATGQGRLNLHILGAFAEFFSDSLAGHVRKARRERFERGLHNGALPFGYMPCTCSADGGTGHENSCNGVVVVEDEAAAIQYVAQRYAVGLISFADAAAELNRRGFSTRHNQRFTSASVRFLLTNPYLVGRVRHRDKATRQWDERPGTHPPILSAATFAQIMDRRVRRELPTRPSHRVYLLKGLVTCVHCGSRLWSETLRSGHSYYREQRGTHQSENCPAAGRSVRCEVIDEQAGEIFGKLVLPANWRDEIQRRLANYDQITSIEKGRASLSDRLRRLTVAYTLGNVDDAEYKRQDMELKRALGRLRIPELDEAVAAGEILADVRKLWERADESERYELLRGMVASIQADLLSGRIVGVTPKPAFWTLFESARVDSSKVLLLKPDEVKRWLAERATADLVMVETGEN